MATARRPRRSSETVLEIDFSGSVAGAGNLAAYQLSRVTTKKVKKKPVITYKPIKLVSALPASSPMTTSVDLVPAKKPNRSQTDRLQITAADITDTLGRALDGNDDGQPGANYVATFGKSGVAVIDALLEQGELADPRVTRRTAR